MTVKSTTTETFIPSKDASLESSIRTLQGKLEALGIHVEEKSWLNEIEGIWSVHVIDRDCTRLFTNGKGASQLAARASALGEYFERLSTNYFWTHFYLGETIANKELCIIQMSNGFHSSVINGLLACSHQSYKNSTIQKAQRLPVN